MKCAFQLVKQEDGSRSLAFVFERGEFAKILRSEHPIELVDSYYVLVLCEFPTRGTDSPEWDFSNAPLMTVRRFVEVFGEGTPFPEQPGFVSSSAEEDTAGDVACL